jgi:hypothetical protein
MRSLRRDAEVVIEGEKRANEGESKQTKQTKSATILLLH